MHHYTDCILFPYAVAKKYMDYSVWSEDVHCRQQTKSHDCSEDSIQGLSSAFNDLLHAIPYLEGTPKTPSMIAVDVSVTIYKRKNIFWMQIDCYRLPDFLKIKEMRVWWCYHHYRAAIE